MRENIGSFGGNPDEITLMGQSSGGNAVAHHLASPISSNLFKRTIIHSSGLRNNFGFLQQDVAKQRAGIKLQAEFVKVALEILIFRSTC